MLKKIFNAGYVYKTYLQLPRTISKPDKCYSLKTLLSRPYLFEQPVLVCNCLYTCRYKYNGGIPSVIHLHDTI